MDNAARSQFFANVRAAEQSSQVDRALSREARLEHSIVNMILVSGGLGGCLSRLMQECKDSQQLDELEFNLAWFEASYPKFNAKILPGIADYVKDTTVVDMLSKPKATPHLRVYFDELLRAGIDDMTQPLCCVFNAGPRKLCVHNMTSDVFAESLPANDTNALLMHTSNGVLCLQWFKHFLAARGTKWASNG